MLNSCVGDGNLLSMCLYTSLIYLFLPAVIFFQCSLSLITIMAHNVSLVASTETAAKTWSHCARFLGVNFGYRFKFRGPYTSLFSVPYRVRAALLRFIQCHTEYLKPYQGSVGELSGEHRFWGPYSGFSLRY